MAELRHRRRNWLAGAALLVAACSMATAQSGTVPLAQPDPPQSAESGPRSGKPLPLKPDLPGMQRNHRLILKDGTFQLVREYSIVGDRVRYLSQERNAWEELPTDLVDWDATRKWEEAHSAAAEEDVSPGMKEAETVDKAESSIREDLRARTPQVAPGLELPDEDGVFVLDTFQGTPELVELPSTDLSLNARDRHGIGVLNPMAGQTANLELAGAHSRIHLHVNDPSIYLSIEGSGDNSPEIAGAITVKTTAGGARPANTKHGAHSAQSGFAIVKVSERNAVRVVGAVHLARDGSVTQDENVIAARAEVMPGKHWLRIQPAEQLSIGEYAIVEILSASDISQTVWDFRVDPTKGDNPGSLTPILNSHASR